MELDKKITMSKVILMQHLADSTIQAVTDLQQKILSHLAVFGIQDNIEQILSDVNFIDVDNKPYKELFHYLITTKDRSLKNMTPSLKGLYNEVLHIATPIEMMPLYICLIEQNIKMYVQDFLFRKLASDPRINTQKIVMDCIKAIENDFDLFDTTNNLVLFLKKMDIECLELIELQQNIIAKAHKIKSNEVVIHKLKSLVNSLDHTPLKIEVKILLKSALIIQLKDHLPAYYLPAINTLLKLQ